MTTTEENLLSMAADAGCLSREAIVAELESPQWEFAGANLITENIRRVWGQLSRESRLSAFLVAVQFGQELLAADRPD